eukprot:3963600-Prorocentrum_lima.AAC.1
MTSSLVGSEMCIRDRLDGECEAADPCAFVLALAPAQLAGGGGTAPRAPVSYTHLTLPTICSV